MNDVQRAIAYAAARLCLSHDTALLLPVRVVRDLWAEKQRTDAADGAARSDPRGGKGMNVHRIADAVLPYRCDGCDRPAEMAIDFGRNALAALLCCECAVGAAGIVAEHAEFFRNGRTAGAAGGAVDRDAMAATNAPSDGEKE